MGVTDPTMLTRSYVAAHDSPPVLEITVGGLLRAAAADAPETIALVAGSADPADRRSWTYAQLVAESEGIARGLLQHFQPGERLLIVARTRPSGCSCRWARHWRDSCWRQPTRPTRSASWTMSCDVQGQSA